MRGCRSRSVRQLLRYSTSLHDSTTEAVRGAARRLRSRYSEVLNAQLVHAFVSDALLISFCLQPRLRHFGRLLAPGRVDHLLALHDSFFMDGYLRPLGGAEGLHLPIRRLARLCSRLGGHGQRATAPEPSSVDEPRLSAAHCDSAWYGSWGSVWRRLRGWLPTLRGVSLAQSSDGAQLEFRTSLASTFDRISTSLASVRAHPHVAMLPIGYSLPVLHTALVDGSSEGSEHLDDDSDADADADARGPPQPSMLYDLDTLDSTTNPHAARAILQR